MSEEQDAYKKRTAGRYQSSKGPKTTKTNYDTRQYNDKETENTRHEQDSGPQRSNDGYRQQNRQNDNQYYQNKNTGYNKGIKRAGTEQINRKKKRDPQPKIPKDAILERHSCAVTLEKDFQEIIDTNPQIFTKEAFLPVNLEFEPIDAPGDDCLNPKPVYTSNSSNNQSRTNQPSRNEGISQEQEPQRPEREERGFVEWDTGDSKDIFTELDSKKMDDQLRGKKKQIGEDKKSKNTREFEKKDAELKKVEEPKKIEEEKKAEKLNGGSGQKSEVLQANDIDEDEGEYSNIDKIFEQKMKAKQMGEGDAEEEDFGLQADDDLQLNPNKFDKDLEDNLPVWEDFNAEDIKKDVENMESLFIGTLDASKQQQYNNKNAYDTFAGDFSKENSSIGQGKFQFSEDGNEMFGFENKSNQQQQGFLTPQQQQELYQFHQQQMLLKQNKMPDQFGYNPNALPTQSPKMNVGRQIGSNQNLNTMQMNPQMMYSQQQLQQQQMYQMQGQGNKTNTTTLGLSKQIPIVQQNKVFKFFCRDDYEKKLWFYKDFQNKVQGPFSAKEMDEWYDNGLLPPTLMITYGENNNFKTLSELIKYISSNSGKQPQQQQQQTQQQQVFQQQMAPKQSTQLNFSTMSSVQFAELTKDPDFLQYAQSARLNLQQIFNSIKEREQQEKYYAANKNWGYNQGSYPGGGSTNGNFESGGYYLNNNQFGGNQPMNKGNFVQSQGVQQEFGYGKQIIQQQPIQNLNNFNNPNMNVNKGFVTQPMQPQKQKMQQQFPSQQQFQTQQFTQQEQQYGGNQGYPTSLSLNNAILQNTQQQRPQQSSIQFQNQGSDFMTNQLKSILGVNGGDLSDLMKGGDKKNEDPIGGRFNSADFPAFTESYK